MVAAVEAALIRNSAPGEWLEVADRVLAETSWDKTWQQMADLIAKVWKLQPKKKTKNPGKRERN
ncbi:MAG: hypothetical protein LC775_10955 [Acidobacteria bacterium]|nr:hypothetical protein [Acidobacteriota bacterium]